MVPLQGVNIPFLRVLSWQPLGRCCFENISTYHNDIAFQASPEKNRGRYITNRNNAV